MDKATLKEVKELFDVGLHLGHKKNRLHPKARRFVYKIESGISIIDLAQTVNQLKKAKEFIAKQAKEGKKILVVATKKAAAPLAQSLSSKENLSYVTTKWLPGLLTNFETIVKNVKKLIEYQTNLENGEYDKLIKHERTKITKQTSRLEKFYGGLKTLEKKPDFLLILDARKEKNAIQEAIKTGIPTVAVIDTNADPDEVDYPIIANDDSPSAIEFLLTQLIQTYTRAFTKELKK